jgi:hypothetical protein
MAAMARPPSAWPNWPGAAATRRLLAWAQDYLDRHAQQRLQPLQPSRALVEITCSLDVGRA